MRRLLNDIMYIILILFNTLIRTQGRSEDYFADNYDENQNCNMDKEQEKRLNSEGKCAIENKGGNELKSLQYNSLHILLH